MQELEKLEKLLEKIEKYCKENVLDYYEYHNFGKLIEEIKCTLIDNRFYSYIMLQNKLEDYNKLFRTYKKQHRQMQEI